MGRYTRHKTNITYSKKIQRYYSLIKIKEDSHDTSSCRCRRPSAGGVIRRRWTSCPRSIQSSRLTNARLLLRLRDEASRFQRPPWHHSVTGDRCFFPVALMRRRAVFSLRCFESCYLGGGKENARQPTGRLLPSELTSFKFIRTPRGVFEILKVGCWRRAPQLALHPSRGRASYLLPSLFRIRLKVLGL